MICLTIAALVVAAFWRDSLLYQTFGMVILESIFLLPALAMVIFRKAAWSSLGLNKFEPRVLGVGCGLMVGGYVLIFIHNLLLVAVNLRPQGVEILELINQLKSPLGLVLGGVLVAPFSEELFFRGFLFGGLEARFGWKKSALISALLFAMFHLDLASLVPTFLLGWIFANLYHQSRSIWPGIVLHFLTNALGICSLLALAQLPKP
jgi:membrane protease YdiL (CAAX protease family)